MTLNQLRAIPWQVQPSRLESYLLKVDQFRNWIDGLSASMLPRLTYKRVGGLTFIRIGRLNLSYCFTSKI